MARPTARIVILTGTAAVAVIVTAAFSGGGPLGASRSDAIRPAGLRVVPEGGACPGSDRRIVLRGLGRPITVTLDGAGRGRERVVARRGSSGGFVRGRLHIPPGARCLPIPCDGPGGGRKADHSRACADR